LELRSDEDIFWPFCCCLNHYCGSNVFLLIFEQHINTVLMLHSAVIVW